jgi:hypothetical protein
MPLQAQVDQLGRQRRVEVREQPGVGEGEHGGRVEQFAALEHHDDPGPSRQPQEGHRRALAQLRELGEADQDRVRRRRGVLQGAGVAEDRCSIPVPRFERLHQPRGDGFVVHDQTHLDAADGRGARERSGLLHRIVGDGHVGTLPA